MNIKVKVPIFHETSVVHFLHLEDDKIEKWIKDNKYTKPKKIDLSLEEATAITASCGFHAVIRFKDDPFKSPELVAHEITHAAIGILKYAGIKLVDESEEIYAYLIGYLTREFYKKL